MQIAQLTIRNILGCKSLEFSPGNFNEISGQNGAGKTSVLEAIKAAVGSGHDATLLHRGAEDGEIVLVLDNGDQIRRRITPSASKTEVTQGGVKAKRPTDVIKQLTDLVSINPIDFLRAPKKDRVRVLLETMPLEADIEYLKKITRINVQAEPGIHALDVIDKVAKIVYDDRTGTNRAIKEKESTINQMNLALPEAPAGVDGSEAEINEAVAQAYQAKEAEMARIQDKLEGIRKDSQAVVDSIRAKAQEAIDAIKNQATIDAENERKKLADIEQKAATQRDRKLEQFTAEVAPYQQSLAIIRANRENVAKREQGLDTVKKMEVELDDLKQDELAQTKSLADINNYKLQLLDSLPIPGLVVRDGEIYRDDIHFDRLNTAQQVQIAVEIAKMRAGDLGLICVDGLELLDKDAFEQFKVKALESGLQLFVTRVSDDDFAVKAE
jgi:DNA repair exonuclease SbcCD ATPase subunit